MTGQPLDGPTTPRRSSTGRIGLGLLAGAVGAGSLMGCHHVGTVDAAAACPFSDWTTYKTTSIKKHRTIDAYYYVTDHTSVDADGAPNAYHPGDVGKKCAATGVGLDCPANAGLPNGSWWNVLVRDPGAPHRPYVQPAGPYKGYYVSATSLRATAGAPTDPAKYADARSVPYIVFPGNFHKMTGTGRVGDVGVAYNLTTRKMTPFIVGDVGAPDHRLGEASIGFWRALGGTAPNPRTGTGVPVGKTVYVVFPYTAGKRPVRWPLTATELRTQALAMLARAGGRPLFGNCK